MKTLCKFQLVVSRETAYSPEDKLVGCFATKAQAIAAAENRGLSRDETFYLNGQILVLEV